MANKRASRKTRKMYRKTRKTNRKSRKNTCANRKRTGMMYRKRTGMMYRRKSRKSRQRRHRGGSYGEALSRPFFASVAPNTLQNTYSAWTGETPSPPTGLPEAHSWSYTGAGIAQSLNPSMITPINSSFTLMASPLPYSPTPLATAGAGVSAGSATVTGASPFNGSEESMAGAQQGSISASMASGRQSLQSY